MKIVRHDTALSIALAYLSFGDETVTSLDQIENVGGRTLEGEEIECSPQDWLAGVEREGFWGYIDEPNETVHLWLGEKADPKLILTLVGHELGHASGVPAPEGPEEEERAMSYGRVAAQSYAIMRRLIDEPGLKEFEVEPEVEDEF